jgi:hypothetical protein
MDLILCRHLLLCAPPPRERTLWAPPLLQGHAMQRYVVFVTLFGSALKNLEPIIEYRFDLLDLISLPATVHFPLFHWYLLSETEVQEKVSLTNLAKT